MNNRGREEKTGRSIKRSHCRTNEKEDSRHSNHHTRVNRCLCETKLPPVPKHDEPPPIPYPPSHENYVEYNAKNVAETTNYQEPKMQMVDSKDGHVTNLDKSGLVPKFVNKPTFGKVPTYLKKSQKNTQQEEIIPERQSDLKTVSTAKDQTAPKRSVNKEIEVGSTFQALQQRWIELEKRLGLVSFSRPDKRELLEDELRSIELRLRMATNA